MATKQKSGLYRAKIKIGVSADGSPIFKYISAKTRKELSRLQEEAVRYYITGEANADDRLFGEYASEWYRLRLVPKVSVSSAQSYRTALNKHILPVFGDRKLRAIRPLDIQVFVDSFAGASASQITYIVATFKKIYKAACADLIVSHDPTAHLVKPESTPAAEKQPLTPAQRAKIVQVCDTHRHGLLLAILYYLGLRGGEARGLQWGDIDWDKHMIHIARDIDDKDKGSIGTLKTKSSDRYIPIPQALYDRLRVERGMPSAYILTGDISGKPITKTVLQRIWTQLMAECDMAEPVTDSNYRDSDPRAKWRPLITPHALRHNYITMCWEAGVDVFTTSKLVGHARIETTLHIYTHLTESAQLIAAEKLDGVFKKSCTKVAQTSLDPFPLEKAKALKSQ